MLAAKASSHLLFIFGGFFVGDHLALMGEVWAPFEREWIFPLGTTTLEGRTLPAPARPEPLLEAMYGPGWKVPDPAFKFEKSDAAQRRFDNEYEQYQAAVERYRRARTSRPSYDDRGPDRYQDNGYDDPNYDPARDYRSGNYQERTLAQDDRVYRGNDGRYYCKRSDGTTGLIVGAAAGGLFGNIIAGRRSSTVGTLLGAIAGGAAGASIDRNQQQVRCR